MKILSLAKDGGPNSPVDAFFIFEIKALCSVAILRFNEGSRETFHSHAFNALTWFICGSLQEQDIDGTIYTYRRSWFPKLTRRTKNHRVIALKNSICITLRGPWTKTWTEDDDTYHTVLTHHRKIVSKTKR